MKVWIGQYGTAIVLVMMLGTVLGYVPLFKQIPLGNTTIMASHAAQWIGYGIALLMIWLLCGRVSQEISEDGEGLTFVRAIIKPMAAVILIMLGYKLLSSGMPAPLHAVRPIVNTVYVAGIISAAAWLTMAWGRNLWALIKFVEGRQIGKLSESTMRLGGPADRTWSGPTGLKAGPGGTVVMKREKVKPLLGRYEIVKELGRGSMGIVYLGKDPTINRSVAIKTMRLDQVGDPDELKEFKERFFREAESTGRLSHPNIVTIYDAGEQEEVGYIAMELLEGVALKQFCRKENLLPVHRVMDMLATVAEALDYAHAQGVVHRDVKPANIMVGKNSTIKVMDFGIARLITSIKTQTTMVLGTPSYMSPEQLNGSNVDGRSDIFSLGVILYELLTGTKPFEAESISSLLFKIVHEPYLSPVLIRPDLPSCAEMILNRALQKNAGERYQNAGELAHGLRTCLQSRPA